MMRHRKSVLCAPILVLALFCGFVLLPGFWKPLRPSLGWLEALQDAVPGICPTCQRKQPGPDGLRNTTAPQQDLEHMPSRATRPHMEGTANLVDPLEPLRQANSLDEKQCNESNGRKLLQRSLSRCLSRRGSAGEIPGGAVTASSHAGRVDNAHHEQSESMATSAFHHHLDGHEHRNGRLPTKRRERLDAAAFDADRMQPEPVVIARAAKLARYIYAQYPQLKRMRPCPTADGFARTVAERIRWGDRRHLRASLASWRQRFRKSRGLDEHARLHAWVEYVVFRASQPTGPHWPSDVELQAMYAELGAPRQAASRSAPASKPSSPGGEGSRSGERRGGEDEQESGGRQRNGLGTRLPSGLPGFQHVNGLESHLLRPSGSNAPELRRARSADDARIRHHGSLVRRAAMPAARGGSVRERLRRPREPRPARLRLVSAIAQQVVDSGGRACLANLPSHCRTGQRFLQCVESRAPEYQHRSAAHIEDSVSHWHRVFLHSGGHNQVARLNAYVAWIYQRAREGSAPSAAQLHYLHLSLDGKKPVRETSPSGAAQTGDNAHGDAGTSSGIR